ncbi:MAG: hypothetical protein HN368_11395 [Spirochaetales bacterium]|jgi:hypothetical protein|nr:hypothetical protein [Spirochaetales bacterium]
MKLITSPESLTIDLEGPEILFALRQNVFVRKLDIANISFHARFQDWDKMELRLPGSYMPGVLLAGSYFTGKGWDFFYLKKPRGLFNPYCTDVLVIETLISKFKRIAVSSNAQDASRVIAWGR